MRIRSFIIAYALVLAILLFADRRPGSTREDHYSHVVDLTDGHPAIAPHSVSFESRTRLIAPGALIPGTWAAGQIPSERLVAPLVVMDLNAASLTSQGVPRISLDDISAWESRHGMIPQGAVVAIRGAGTVGRKSVHNLDQDADDRATPLPIARDAAMFLVESRATIGFAVETPVDFSLDRTLAQQLALRGNYVVEGAAPFASLPSTGSLIIVAPEKNAKPGTAPVRVLAMVK
jgi:kynurenine formamidase